MAIRTNTTKTVERTSSALLGKCEATEKNMAQLMERAGCAGAKMKSVTLPLIPGSKDDVQYVGLNGADFYFLRGKTCQMPEPVYEILHHTGNA